MHFLLFINGNQSLIFIKKLKIKKIKNFGKKVYVFYYCEQLTGNRTEKLVNRLFWFRYGLGFRQTEIFG